MAVERIRWPQRPLPPPITGFDPFKAPRWVQPYLDCVDGIEAHGIGNGLARIIMHRGGREVGVVIIKVDEGEG